MDGSLRLFDQLHQSSACLISSVYFFLPILDDDWSAPVSRKHRKDAETDCAILVDCPIVINHTTEASAIKIQISLLA
jgi:hypothetical protein